MVVADLTGPGDRRSDEAVAGFSAGDRQPAGAAGPAEPEVVTQAGASDGPAAGPAEEGTRAQVGQQTSVHQYHEKVIEGLMGPVLQYHLDPSISEIMINGWESVFIEREGRLHETGVKLEGPAALEALARGILQYSGKRLTPDVLSIEARLPNGSRVHIVQPPAARPGICIAIRKFPARRLTLTELVQRQSLTCEAESYLREAMRLRRNIIVSGGTGSGKTTVLNVLGELVDVGERVIVIEDSSELQLPPELHVVQMEAVAADRQGRGGATIRDLFRASLRMRPDRILVGECRGGEAIDMVQAMNSGHSGSLSTVHANGPRDALSRLETLCLMSDIRLPLVALQRQLAAAVDIIVQVGRSEGYRRVLSIDEIEGFDLSARDYRLRQIFSLIPDPDGPAGQRLGWTGARPVLRHDPRVDIDALTAEWVAPA